ncbi:DUF3613 domain-containing protein [Variovorax sp. GB1P17]|uniref:DUF3613 domain-containing protein n=1 Tax=Variovorax sp. GB1P17 TaxID=3443740 RepID=UPI003F451877
MKQSPLHLGTTLQAIGLVLAFMMFSPATMAQESAAKVTDRASASETPKAIEAQTPPVPMASNDEFEADPGPLQVGDATQDLLAWQRSGVIASPTPRPIPGAVAYRSYERYLKSFEYPIPEHLNSSVKTQSGSGK